MTKRLTLARKEVFADKLAAQLGKTRRKFEIPTPQRWYHFANGTWTSSTPPTTPSTTAPPRISVTTWNIDAIAPASERRMTAALSHLSDLHGSEDLPSIIFLQEMLDADIEQIKAAPWVRERFFITDVEGNKSAMFGTTTLVDRRLDVREVFRVLYDKAAMQRDALFVDVAIGGDRSMVSLVLDFPLLSLFLSDER